MAKKNKETAKQREARIAAEKAKQEAYEAKQKRNDIVKRVLIAVVCIIFALALALPTVGLSLLGGGGA